MPRSPRYSETEARAAIAGSVSWAEALRRLGMCDSGGADLILRKYAAIWGIQTEHFDPYARARTRQNTPLEEILVRGSTFSRGHLKRRLLREGVKQPICELCGQGVLWRGRRMSLVLDHINGVRDDHRLENLRILCSNCNATLDTHCGRNKPRLMPERECPRCGSVFTPDRDGQRYCSRACGATESVVLGRTSVASSVRRTSGLWLSLPLRATWRLGGGTACPTTPSASGFVRTSGSGSGRRRWPHRPAPGRVAPRSRTYQPP
jgi:HNH endonuclease